MMTRDCKRRTGRVRPRWLATVAAVALVTFATGLPFGLPTTGDDGGQESAPDPPPNSAFISVSAGHDHTCGVKTDGPAVCWGGDWEGQSTPPDDAFTSVSAGGEHTCGVKTDNSVECWGDGSHGQNSPSGSPPTTEEIVITVEVVPIRPPAPAPKPTMTPLPVCEQYPWLSVCLPPDPMNLLEEMSCPLSILPNPRTPITPDQFRNSPTHGNSRHRPPPQTDHPAPVVSATHHSQSTREVQNSICCAQPHRFVPSAYQPETASVSGEAWA